MPSEVSIAGRESPLNDEKRRGNQEQQAKSPVVDGQDRAKCVSPRFLPAENVAEKSEVAAVRPVNLTLAETCETKPPPRLMKIVRLRQAKREGRLLSVPNLKFAKNDPAMICDLRCEEANTGSESFTCNLIRRFSKCLKLE